MRSNLIELYARTALLRRNLELAESVDALRSWRRPHARRYAADRQIEAFQRNAPGKADTRGFTNSGILVGLYGALEQYVERLIEDSVETYIACCQSYAGLPGGVLRQYSILSAEVLTAMAAERYSGSVTEEELAAGLYGTLKRTTPIPLATGVFSRHTANFRWELIKSLFARAGLDVASTRTSSHLTDAMAAHFPDEGDPVFVINDLAERRNALAHGITSDLLSFELLGSYVAVIEAFAEALYASAASATLRVILAEGAIIEFGSLGRPDRVFRREVAGYLTLPQEVATGRVVAIIRSDRVSAAVVKEIQVNNATVKVAEQGSSAGLRLSAPLSGRSRLCLLPDNARRIAE
ncbi:HEPN domain-containing protein [Nocardioides houyundeii]|uniref:HEPN domain-containing protein n=1 Tax=Nocardioides houyundeii TaxID=2045452 RepID=UPI001315A614|nr:HEPN domain-containing protein [Nocardioides houyundeii]